MVKDGSIPALPQTDLLTTPESPTCGAPFSLSRCAMPAFLRLVQRDNRVPLLLTLCDEYGIEIDSATATDGDAAIDSAIMLLSRAQTLRPGYRLTVAVGGDGAQR